MNAKTCLFELDMMIHRDHAYRVSQVRPDYLDAERLPRLTALHRGLNLLVRVSPKSFVLGLRLARGGSTAPLILRASHLPSHLGLSRPPHRDKWSIILLCWSFVPVEHSREVERVVAGRYKRIGLQDFWQVFALATLAH